MSEIQALIDFGVLTQEAVDEEYDRRVAEFEKQYSQFSIKESQHATQE